MPFTTDSLARLAAKRMVGKTHTGNAKDPGNESIGSNVLVAGKSVLADTIPLTPPGASTTVIRACITALDGELDLDVDPSSSKAYFATVPIGHALTGFVNPETGVNYVAGERVQNILDARFGSGYRPIPKDNGVEISPVDSRDWIFDAKAGVLVSEDDLSLGATGTIACYVYVGSTVETSLSSTSGSIARTFLLMGC